MWHSFIAKLCPLQLMEKLPGAGGEGGAEEHEAGGAHQAAQQGAPQCQGRPRAGEKAQEGPERHNQGALEGDPVVAERERDGVQQL